MNPSLTGFYRVGQKVSEVILVLRLTPIAHQPSTISSLYFPYISATAKNTDIQAAYVALWPSLWKPCEICAPWKCYLECEWRVCVSSTDALVINKHCNFCCFRTLAYTTSDRLCAVHGVLQGGPKSWDRLCRDVVGRWLVGRWLSRACTVAKRCILSSTFFHHRVTTPF